MTAVDTLIADLKAQKISGLAQPVVVSIDDFVAALTQLQGGSIAGPAGGDLSGTYPNPTVAKIQGTPVNAAAPTNLQRLIFDNVSGTWKPTTVSAGAPSIVQHGASAGAAIQSITFGVAPTPGNLLVALFSHFGNDPTPSNPAAGKGWANFTNTNGVVKDGFAVSTKIAQAGESTTQTPLNAANTGGLSIWEIQGPFNKIVDAFAGQHDISSAPNIVQAITTDTANGLILAICVNTSNTTNTTGVAGGLTQDDATTGGARAITTGHMSAATAATYNPQFNFAANQTVCTLAVAIA